MGSPGILKNDNTSAADTANYRSRKGVWPLLKTIGYFFMVHLLMEYHQFHALSRTNMHFGSSQLVKNIFFLKKKKHQEGSHTDPQDGLKEHVHDDPEVAICFTLRFLVDGFPLRSAKRVSGGSSVTEWREEFSESARRGRVAVERGRAAC